MSLSSQPVAYLHPTTPDTRETVSHSQDLPTDTSLVTHINAFGEIPLAGAPSATLANGQQAIPQQFFVCQRNREIVENIISHIQFDDNYPLFVSEASGHLFLQVGIIGQENYPPNQAKRPKKIVYGRKWFIEPTQPTSEIIQTAFLALIKAREHELREFFCLTYEVDGQYKRATPFNSHIDLPLMAQHPELFSHTDIPWRDAEQAARALLERIYLAHVQFTLTSIHRIDTTQLLMTLDLSTSPSSPLAHFFPELTETTLTILTAPNDNAFLFSLINALLAKSQQHVEEKFTFQGLARFSQQLHAQAIGEFSLHTRILPANPNHEKEETFRQLFREMTAQVDAARAPSLACHPTLHQHQQQALASDMALEGYLPTYPSA